MNIGITTKFDAAPVELPRMRWPLLRAQERLAPWLPALERACELSARVLRRPILSGRDNTRRCYESFFDPLCADTGVWPDYTEGHYPEGSESYEDAQDKQLDFILDSVGCEAGVRVLDIGCGNGRLLRRARARGCEVSGLTISRTQAASCRAEGLDVRVCSFDEALAEFGRGSFDVVILNGPTEHFVSQEDAAAGRGDAIVRELFEIVAGLLRPGGRVFVTCIHFRWPTDPHEVCKPPLEHPIGSYYFYCSILVDIYSGWYPEDGAYLEAASSAGLDNKMVRDATRDYYLTSRQWSTRLQGYLRAHPRVAASFLTRLFAEDPRYFFSAFLFWFYDPWTWQFRPTEALAPPMVHRWLMFEKPARDCAKLGG